MQYVMGP